jgi:Protein of unknown function (DUF3800)
MERRLFLFADEAGCLTFTRAQNVSRHFVICTIALDNCELGGRLLDLRRRLAWEGAEMGAYFHASTDRQDIRNHVFDLLAQEDFSIQATILEKSKAQPHIRASDDVFYRYGWYYHWRYGSRPLLHQADEFHLTIASIGTKKKKTIFENAVRGVIAENMPNKKLLPSFWPAQADPCLWIADYCTWAIFRKYESDGRDLRSYSKISNKINYELNLWSHGMVHYY